MAGKVIVTHIFPDLDAIGACWLLVRFDPEFNEAGFEFVPAGATYKNLPVDSDPTVVHVDTGMGQFDHHQSDQKTCASELVFNYLKNQKLIALKHRGALERLIRVIIALDNFDDCFWPGAAADYFDLGLSEVINNLKISGSLNDKELVYQGMILLDAVLTGMLIKIKAEEEIKTGLSFKSRWGQALAVESKHSLLSKLAQKMGFALVIRREPQTGFVSVKAQPRPEIDLTPLYQKLKQADPKASWFFHPSRHIIVNGSRHSPGVKPANLNLESIIEIVKQI